MTGVDLVWSISELAEQKKYPVYFLGAGEMVAAIAAEVLQKKFPELKFVGAESGGEIANPQATDQDLVERINDAKPKILFIAFGHVKQEKWIFHHLDQLPSVKLAIGVGGALDYISGTVKRAPKFLQRAGLEWLYRLIKQPSRWKRILDATIVFPLLIVIKKLFQKEKVSDEIE